MTIWSYKSEIRMYEDTLDINCENIKSCRETHRGSLAFTSNEHNGSIEFYDSSYKDTLRNILHFTIIGVLALNLGVLKKKEELQLEGYYYDPDTFKFEEYIALNFSNKTIIDTAAIIISEDQKTFLKDTKIVMDAIGLEIK